MTGIHLGRSGLFTCALMFSIVTLSGCKSGGGGGGSDGPTSSVPAATTTSAIPVSSANAKPTISGSPAATARSNSPYSFVPTASDADGDTVSFQIQNKPTWATFNTVTGELSGKATIGTFAGIVISASDGKSAATLAPFSIAVTEHVKLKADIALSWAAPTQNSDGTVLTDLAGYIIAYGKSKDALSESVRIDNPSVDRYVFDSLSAGTYYFGLRAVAADGELSDLSKLVKKIVPNS
jgi:hypothetical protein